jgi:DNA replication protein DnaC
MVTQQEQAGMYEVYRSRGVLAKWHPFTFDNFTENDAVKQLVLDYIEEAKTMKKEKGFLFTGGNGTGKTMLMNLLMKKFIDMRETVHVISFPTLVGQYAKNWRGEGMLGALMKVQYLAIDDMGKEFTSSDVSKDLVTSAFDYVLRYRTQDCKATFITSNLKLHEIRDVYSPAIESLTSEAMTIVELDGQDYRRKNLQEVKSKGKTDGTGKSTLLGSGGKKQ